MIGRAPKTPKYNGARVLVAIRLWTVLALCACGNASSSTEQQEAEKPAVAPKIDEALAAIVATCARCDGAVEVRRRGKPYWEPIAVGGTFRDGDWIRTGAGGTARVRFVSGGHLDLEEKTTLFVEADGGTQGDKVAAVHVAMQSGAATGELEGADAPIKLRTSEGDVRLGATDRSEFRLSPSGDGTVEVAVNKGEMIVRRRDGERRIAARPTEPVVEEPPPKVAPRPRPIVRKPRPKPARIAFPSSVSPKVDARFKCVSGLAIPLRWNPVAGATRYRVVVARDMSFRSVVLNKELTATQVSFFSKGAGTYVWRVAARDARGYGEFGFARRIFCN